MTVTYSGCSPLDRSDAIGNGFYRLTFTTANDFLEQALEQSTGLFTDVFSGNAETMLNRIGKTPVLFPIQDPPTIINDPVLGQAATVDCQVRSGAGGIPLQVALQAVSDSYSGVTLYSCEAHSEGVTDVSVAARPAAQAATATAAAAAVTAASPFSALSTGLKWAVVAIGILVIGLIVWKAPKAGGA